MKAPLSIVSCFLILQVSAQSYYPGGLGNSNLFLWLNAKKSSSVTMNGSNQVSQWSDLSGNGYNFTQSTTSQKPLYSATGSPASKPALTFNANNSQYLGLGTLSSSLSFASGISVLAQASYSGTLTGWGWQRIFDFGNGTSSDNFMMGRNGNTANNYYEGWNGGSGDQTYTSTNPIVNGSENLYEAIQSGGTAGTTTSVSQYLAGASQTVTGAAGSSITWLPKSLTRSNNYLGRSNWTSDEYFNGTMSELLFYNTALNTTQRVILENYLGAEWNQTVSVTEYTAPSATTYRTNLVGIGYTSATDYFLTDATGSTDGLGFSSGTTVTGFLHSAGYLMAAHNGQANTTLTNTTVPGITTGSNLSRWNRSWYVQKTGGTSTGSVNLNFIFSDYDGSIPNASGSYALLYNATDGTFATGTNQLVSTLTTTVFGGAVTFKVTASNLSNGYYTILYSPTVIFLPVTLTSFTAAKQGSTAFLQWATSQQTAFSHFSVERSSDGIGFTSIGTVSADANSTTGEQYTFTDNTPLAGTNYYRLAMVDQDGAMTWSPVHTIGFGAGGAPTLSVYPNPVVSSLHLTLADAVGDVSIRLLSSQGMALRTMSAVAPATVDIPMNGLPTGIYFLEINGTNGHYVREIMKN